MPPRQGLLEDAAISSPLRWHNGVEDMKVTKAVLQTLEAFTASTPKTVLDTRWHFPGRPRDRLCGAGPCDPYVLCVGGVCRVPDEGAVGVGGAQQQRALGARGGARGCAFQVST